MTNLQPGLLLQRPNSLILLLEPQEEGWEVAETQDGQQSGKAFFLPTDLLITLKPLWKETKHDIRRV